MRRSSFALLTFTVLLGYQTAIGATINSVTITGAPANPTISVSGSGFGTAPATTFLGFTGFTGFDYGTNLYITDLSPTHGFDAGQDAGFALRDTIGLDLLTYTDTQVVFQLGSDYALSYFPSGIYAFNPGDPYNVVVKGAPFSGTVVNTAAVNPAATPEPASIVTVLTGLASAGLFASRRRQWIAS
jgi:hypothetical protein